MTVIGYTFEGGIYCEPCTQRRFGNLELVMIDREGNVVHPIFGTDELSAHRLPIVYARCIRYGGGTCRIFVGIAIPRQARKRLSR